MRSFLTLLLLALSGPSLLLAQDPCDGYEACFEHNELIPGVHFFDNCSSFPNNAQFFWNFGDGFQATTLNAEHTYAQPGTYQACLTAFWGNCVDTTCTTITVGGNPQPCDPNFEVAMGWNDSGTGLVTFNATSNHSNTNFIWYYGDGTEGYGPATTHTYALSGTYSVCVSGWYYNEATEDSCWTEDCAIVIVQGGDPCTGYEACFVSNALPNNVFFGDNCSSFPANAQYFWSFGDGATASTEHGEHQYALPGTYPVCLTVWWGNCSDTTCTTITIGNNPEPCDPNFEVAMTWNVGPQNEVFFVATSNHVNTNFIWYFGDGTEGYGPTTTHTYAQGGTYGVCVSGWYYNEATEDSCWVEDCATIIIQNGPCDGVEACIEVNQLPQPGAFFFGNCSTTPGNAQYLWNFGDGSTSTSPNADHLYTTPGTYTVCLKVVYENCTSTACETVVVPDTECGALMANFGSSVSGNTVEFQNATTGQGTGTQWFWTFGDGSTSNLANPTHTYADAGAFQVCLTVVSILPSNGQGITCQDSYCTMVYPFGPVDCNQLQAGFIANVGNATVQFSNTTMGTGFSTTWHWDFGDGTTSSDAQPSHVFPGLGTYQVCLTAISIYEVAGGGVQTCVDTTCMPVVTGGDNVCDQLQAGFLANVNASGVQFSNTTTGTGMQTSFYWSFGDGSTSNDAQPYHTYTASGTYEVCLTAISIYELGGSGFQTCVDTVCMPVVSGVADPCDGLNAEFDAVVTGSLVNIQNAVVDPTWTYLWTFGDGSAADGPDPFHYYTAPGVYDICLVVYTWSPATQDTCFLNYCETITITDGDVCDQLQAGFMATVGDATVFFSNTTTGTGFSTTWHWDFGDGTTSSDAQPSHVFPGLDTYQVCLTAISIYEVAGGGVQTCVDTTCMAVVTGGDNVCDQLDAEFITTPNGLAIQFASNSSGVSPQSQFFWTFGDGSTGSGPNPLHDYAEQGVYEVCLHVVSVYEVPGQGLVTCEDDQCYTVDVGFGDPCEELVACFEALPFENGAYTFVNCSQVLPIDIPFYFFWDFGDGTTSTEFEPGHAFTAGTYTVCLTVIHGNCVDSTCATVVVPQSGPCSPNFLADFSWTSSGTSVVFNGSSTMPANGFIWNFGDGSPEGYQQVMTHLYEPPGPFEVCLTAWYWNEEAQDTCFASYCDLVNPFANSVNEHFGSNVGLYPVPAREQLTITGLPVGTALRLFTADGRLVRSANAMSATYVMDVHELATGSYVLRLEHATGNAVRKVVVE